MILSRKLVAMNQILKQKMYKMKNIISKIWLGGLTMLALYSGCKKYENPPRVFEDPAITASPSRKVLVISIDGVTGAELKSVAPANLTAMQKSSKYSYNASLDKSKVTDASSWVSMLTGVDYNAHKISQATFSNDIQTGADAHAPIPQFNTFLDYSVQSKGTKSAFITPWEALRNYLNNFPDFLPLVTTDQAVKDSTVKILSTQNQLGAVFVNFREVVAAGDAGGYSASGNPEYKAKIEQSDKFVGEILTALKSRKNFNREDWLVVVTTNHGGSEANPKNGFLIAQNPRFREFELQDRSILYPNMPQQTTFAVAGNGGALYDGGATTKDLTVQMQVKFNSSVSYPGFLTKSSVLSGSSLTGWYWMQANNNWHLNVGGSANGSGGRMELAVTNANLADFRWHTLAMVLKYDAVAKKRMLKAYVDGKKFATEMDITNMKDLSNTNPLQLGVKGNSGNTNFYASNLAIFNTALDDVVLYNTFNLQDFSKHPNVAQMVGYWPMSEQGGTTLNNTVTIAGSSNLVFNTAPNWLDLVKDNNLPAGVDFGVSSQLKPASITAMLMYWMNIPVLTSYNITGDTILDKFEIEFKGK